MARHESWIRDFTDGLRLATIAIERFKITDKERQRQLAAYRTK
jgi:hypothetical protein